MRLKVFFIFTLLLISVSPLLAQWDAQISQYWRIKNFYNPSFVGETNNIENVLLHRRQWVGVSHAPVTSIASINMPFEFLGRKHGVGFMFNNESIGLFSNTTMTLQYGYKIQIRKGKFLNIGLQASMVNIGFNAAEIHIPESDYHKQPGDDPAIPTGGDGRAYDGGIGVSWITDRYWVAVSTNHIWEPSFELDDEHSSHLARAFYLMGGYNIKLSNTLFELQPSTLVKYDGIAPPQIDVTAKVEYNKMFSGGFSWRRGDAFVFLLGAKLGNIEAGYSYDITTSAMSLKSDGSHELFLRYTVPFQKKKTLSGQKSIRIL